MESKTKEKAEINEEYKRETLCSNNLQVQFNLKQLKKFLKDNKFFTSEAQKALDESLVILRYMKKQGQKMESRLELYNRTITDTLGFVRVKKHRKEVEDFISKNSY